jgi:hypothetical protein
LAGIVEDAANILIYKAKKSREMSLLPRHYCTILKWSVPNEPKRQQDTLYAVRCQAVNEMPVKKS